MSHPLTLAEAKLMRARRLERTALALFSAVFGFVAGAALTFFLLTQGA